MLKRIAFLPVVLLCGAGLLNCGDDAEDLPRLEFLSSTPGEVTVGDTTEPLKIRKFFVDPRGREDVDAGYSSFAFESSDTAVLKVVDDRRLVGVAAGEASITAYDLLSDADTRDSLVVTVKPRP